MPKTEMLRLRLASEEKAAFERAAELCGLPVSAWVRERLRGAARRELTDSGEQVPFYKRASEEL
jgi:hypothetical protein